MVKTFLLRSHMALFAQVAREWRGAATSCGGGANKVLPLPNGAGAKQVLAMLKGGQAQQFLK